jgi:hypothetical protein
VIDPNPVATPSPASNTPPEKPPEARKPVDRREAIQKAFNKAREGGEPPAAKPKIGHNQPPEQTPPEDKIDLRQPPKGERYREGGRFAKAPDIAPNSATTAPPGQPAQPGQPQARRYAPLPETDPYRAPPSRWVPEAQEAWAGTPPSVRSEVYRMAQEFDGAYQKYRGDHEAMEPIRHFQAMAAQHGTTLERALTNYVSMEQKLRQDVVGGLDVIVNNLNLRTQDGQRIGLRDIAYHVLSQSPEQLRQMQQGNQQTAASHQIGALHQEVVGLKQALQQMHTQQQFTYTRSAVDQFAEQHPRFDELGELIEQELRFGFDLQTAYQRAEMLRPAQRTAQTRATAPAQTRTDKSISGAPDSGPSNGSARSDKKVGRRDAIQAAIRRVNGGI